jgi:hypothetical protein
MTDTRDRTALKRESVDQMLAVIRSGGQPFPGYRVELPADFDLEEAYRTGAVEVMVTLPPTLDRFEFDTGWLEPKGA